MSSKIKNAIIFISIAVILVLAYIFLIKGDAVEDNLVSFTPTLDGRAITEVNSPDDQAFLPLLLSVKGIRLNDSIFSDPAFIGLIDSTIILTPDGNEGRINPFAPIGSEDTSDQSSQAFN